MTVDDALIIESEHDAPEHEAREALHVLATEVERLRAAVAGLESDIEMRDKMEDRLLAARDKLHADRESLRADVERLRVPWA